jgi:protein-S-isoprenylcysteine O-methyltransferase Ste14
MPKIIPFSLNISVAILLLGIGFFFAIWSNFEMYRSDKGSPVPLKETHTAELVIKGPYKYSRNPMVFRYILFWIGLGFFLIQFFSLLELQ